MRVTWMPRSPGANVHGDPASLANKILPWASSNSQLSKAEPYSFHLRGQELSGHLHQEPDGGTGCEPTMARWLA
jgi:hypothetical protein